MGADTALPTPPQVHDAITGKGPAYPAVSHEKLGELFTRHMDRMTREELHLKSEIAAQLAWRDLVLLTLMTHGRDNIAGEAINVLSDALARCRAVFPTPPQGSPYDQAWHAAMAEPVLVADYLSERALDMAKFLGRVVGVCDGVAGPIGEVADQARMLLEGKGLPE